MDVTKPGGRGGAHVLQAELQLLLVGHEVVSHLHCQVVERQNAVEEGQHLSRRSTEGTVQKQDGQVGTRFSPEHRENSRVPPRRISSCLAPDGSGRRTPPTTRRSSHALCPGVHQPEKHNEKNSTVYRRASFLLSWHLPSPPEAGFPSSWQRDSRVCPPGSNIFHCPSQTSSSFPAGHRRRYGNK